jgi:hypothetical protein
MNEIEAKNMVRRADHAERILKDPLINEAFDAIRDNIFKKISVSSFGQKDEREDLYRMLRAVESFEGQFKKYINDGKLAKNRLKELLRIK